MVDTMSLPAILVGSLLGLLVCILIAAVVYTVCKRRKILTEDEEKVLPPKVYQVSICYLFIRCCTPKMFSWTVDVLI